MKRYILLGIIAFLTIGLSAQTYHFQQGFESTSPSGWVRNCGGTNSLVNGLYAGNNALKFDNTTTGKTNQLETPAVNGAGTLTFWSTRNANAVYFDLHICKIVNNGAPTEIKVISNTDIPHKNNGWKEFSVVINEPANNVKIMIWAEDKGESTSFVAIDDIALTTYDGNGEENPDPEKRNAYERIVTNFGDGTWGTIAESQPASGNYPTDTINDFILNKAIVYAGSTTDGSGEKHTYRIGIDKKSQGGNLELPWLKTVGQVEIHAAVGTAGNTFVVEEYKDNTWSTLETFAAIKTDSTFYLNIERDDTTRLRIANNSNGSVVVWKVLTRSLEDVKNLNVTGSVPVQNAVCFYNLTKEIKITFNRELVFGTGNLLLNEIEIPLSSCTLDEDILLIPVTLESTQGTNKTYTLTIPAGAFIEKDNTENKNSEFILNFETLRKPVMPSNYSEIIDINYSDASTEMCRMDFYYPADATESTPVVINMHGGGWNHGAKEEQTGFATFTKLGFAVANVEYRMTPQATAPAAVEDIRCALQYLLKNAETLHINPLKIVFQGASAGGHLALTAAYLQNNRTHDTNCNDYQGEIKIMAIIDKYGPAKLTDFMFYKSLVDWLGDKSEDDDFIKSISPADMVDANTPPTYIVHGDADPTVPYGQSVTLAAVLEANNVDYEFTTIPNGGHGGFDSQYNTQISNEITGFLTKLLDKTSFLKNNTEKKLFHPMVINDAIYFNCTGNGLFEIFDMQGTKLGETSAANFNLQDSGVFIIKAKIDNQRHITKIVK